MTYLTLSPYLGLKSYAVRLLRLQQFKVGHLFSPLKRVKPQAPSVLACHLSEVFTWFGLEAGNLPRLGVMAVTLFKESILLCFTLWSYSWTFIELEPTAWPGQREFPIYKKFSALSQVQNIYYPRKQSYESNLCKKKEFASPGNS